MLLNKKAEGSLGESLAEKYLVKHHYQILEKNFRTRNGEIDIIAIDTAERPHILCFVEVKTRKTDEYGSPLEAIHYYKLQALRRTAEYYSLTHPKLPNALRLDAVAVVLTESNKLASIELVKNIG